MFFMEESFFKSAFPDSSFLPGDSTLALPPEPDRRTPEVSRTDRSARVQQQVQLTLARRARRSASHGSLHLQTSIAKSFDAADGTLQRVTLSRPSCTGRSLSNKERVRRPSRRVEVSPPPSPEIASRRFLYGTHRFGTCTLPGSSHSYRNVHSLGSDSFRRYAVSEAPKSTWLRASTSANGGFRQGRHAFADAAFQHDYGSRWATRSVSRQLKHTQGGDGVSGDELSGLAQVSRDSLRRLRRLKSYPPSVISMEEAQANRFPPRSEVKPPLMTLERAVNMLTQDDDESLIRAAGYIRSQCLKSADAKKMVYFLRGIPKLLRLLYSDNEEVQCVAAGALRNVVYQSSENKMEVKENDGLATVCRVLKSNRDVQTRRQLAGLLWNLSSHDLLKEALSREGLSVLTQSVLVPTSGISEGENPKDELLADAEVFHSVTGCLRNLSSAGPDGRKAMRECDNLIDSLVYYIRGTIADHKTDDKSTENCVCILHNLSYQMESELPNVYTRALKESKKNMAPKPKTVGCFANRSAKITEELERQCTLLEEKANPRGTEWLWSSITIRMYLSLMACSKHHSTQEAAVGALQNITAGTGAMTEAIAFTIVQRENGLQHVKKMLQEGESDVKRTCVSLIRNVSRHRELHPDIVNQVLPEMVEMLPNDDTGIDLPTEVTASLCHTLINLCQGDTQNVRAVVGQGALSKIINISSADNGYGPSRAGQAACLLLHTLWKHVDLQGVYKKCGYRKCDFISARTTKALNNSRV